jgi:hypothetical protein
MLLRIHRTADNHEVVGICDKELIGTTLAEGDLTIFISPAFFGNEEANEGEVLKVLAECENINMFGERCISLAIKNGYIDRDSCRTIAGVPHAVIL